MRLLSLFAVAMAGLIAVPALAQTPLPDGTPTRVRGTVEKLDDRNLTVKSRDGQSLSITLAPDGDIITLVKKSLAHIKPGDFVASTGVKDKDGKIHAIEARIFLEALADQTPERGAQYARLKLAGLDDAPCHIAVFADRETTRGVWVLEVYRSAAGRRSDERG